MSTLETLPVELVEQVKIIRDDPTKCDRYGSSLALSSGCSGQCLG